MTKKHIISYQAVMALRRRIADVKSATGWTPDFLAVQYKYAKKVLVLEENTYVNTER